jgi:hypothetical protein
MVIMKRVIQLNRPAQRLLRKVDNPNPETQYVDVVSE